MTNTTYTDIPDDVGEILRRIDPDYNPADEPDPAPEDDITNPSWHPIDLGPIFAADYEPPRPTVARFTEGDAALFYPGALNSIYGQSGTGKSWVALHAIAQEIRAGNRAMLIDLESNPAEIAHRLRLLGVAEAQALEHLDYVRPDSPAGVPTVEMLAHRIESTGTTLVVVDSLGEALALWGVDENSNSEVTPWIRAALRPLADAGAAVVAVDHVAKNDGKPSHALGAQRKRAAVSGASFLLEAVKAPTVGEGGRLRLTCTKDRNGAWPAGKTAADVTLDPTVDDGLRIALWPADDLDTNPNVILRARSAEVVRFVCEADHPPTVTEIYASVKGKKEAIRAAIDYALGEGAIRRETGERGAHLHHYVRDLDTSR